MRRVRDDDSRSDELLATAGRRAFELGLAIGWTSGIRGEKAKAASDRGTFAWKNAARFVDADFAAGVFVEQCRTRNPVVVASKSNLVLVDVDGPLELLERFGLELPVTVSVRSARGWHFWLTPPEERSPMKVQISAQGVVISDDGYVVMPPGLHETGHVYAYERAPLWTP